MQEQLNHLVCKPSGLKYKDQLLTRYQKGLEVKRNHLDASHVLSPECQHNPAAAVTNVQAMTNRTAGASCEQSSLNEYPGPSQFDGTPILLHLRPLRSIIEEYAGPAENVPRAQPSLELLRERLCGQCWTSAGLPCSARSAFCLTGIPKVTLVRGFCQGLQWQEFATRHWACLRLRYQIQPWHPAGLQSPAKAALLTKHTQPALRCCCAYSWELEALQLHMISSMRAAHTFGGLIDHKLLSTCA